MGIGRQLPHRWMAGSAVAIFLLAGLVAAWLIDLVFDALAADPQLIPLARAPYLLTAEMIAVLGLAIAAATATVLRVFGSSGTVVASIVLLALSNAISTSSLPVPLLSSWLERLAHVLPVSVAVRALRGAADDDDGVGTASPYRAFRSSFAPPSPC